jgi:hypothetical protein
MTFPQEEQGSPAWAIETAFRIAFPPLSISKPCSLIVHEKAQVGEIAWLPPARILSVRMMVEQLLVCNPAHRRALEVSLSPAQRRLQ